MMQKQKYNLGNTSVIYDPTDYKIYLFGDNHQVYQDTTIEKHSKNDGNCKKRRRQFFINLKTANTW